MPKLLPLLLLVAGARTIHAQQPFITDDTDTAPRNHFHLELLNEFDRLPGTAFPTLRQNTSRFQMTYGLLSNLEIGFDVPLISIFNSRSTGFPDALGPGDLEGLLFPGIHSQVPSVFARHVAACSPAPPPSPIGGPHAYLSAVRLPALSLSK